MMNIRQCLWPVVGVVAVAMLVACSQASLHSTATPRASNAPSGTKEDERVKAVRPAIDRLTQALQRGDLAASRNAYEAYDAAWNGIEVYINVRSPELYNALEQDLQASIEKGLDAPQRNFAQLTSHSQALGTKYDEAIALAGKGPPLHPLFDDLATLRMVRADLRIATAALGDNDLAKVKQHLATFTRNYPTAQPLLKARSASDEQETTRALDAVNTKLQQSGATTADLKPLVSTLTERYNFGVNLLNAAARNADAKRPAVTDTDKKQLTHLNTVQRDLGKSQSAWEAGRYADAAAAADTAAGPDFAMVQPALAAKAGDAGLKSALDSYAGLVGGPGDATKVRSGEEAALEQVAIAQQALVGQFWTDPQLQAFLASLPKG